jgi:hypothetical protein
MGLGTVVVDAVWKAGEVPLCGVTISQYNAGAKVNELVIAATPVVVVAIVPKSWTRVAG